MTKTFQGKCIGVARLTSSPVHARPRISRIKAPFSILPPQQRYHRPRDEPGSTACHSSSAAFST